MDNALPGHGGFVEQAHIAKGIVIYGQLDDLVGQLRPLAAVCLVLQPVNELLAPVAVKAAHVEIAAPAEGAVDKVVGSPFCRRSCSTGQCQNPGWRYRWRPILLTVEGHADAHSLQLLLHQKRDAVQGAGRIIGHRQGQRTAVLFIQAILAAV